MTESKLLDRLTRAQTEEERSWIVTESFLQTLPVELATAAWAAAIPHWFNADILIALNLELKPQAESLYTLLQTLPFVEVFPERGHNLRERTRKLMLRHLWEHKREVFCQLSANAAAYFAQAGSTPAVQIECLYHSVLSEQTWATTNLQTTVQEWTHKFQRAELETLISTLLEQVEEQRSCHLAAAEIYYWAGNLISRSSQQTEALSYYKQALSLFHSIGSRQKEAQTLRAIGSGFQASGRHKDALKFHKEALNLFRSTGERLQEALTLRTISSVWLLLQGYEKALAYSEQALELFRNLNNISEEAFTLRILAEILEYLDRGEEALSCYYQALRMLVATGDRQGEAYTLYSIGNLLESIGNYKEALAYYQKALELFLLMDDRWGQACTLQTIGIFQDDFETGLSFCLTALQIFEEYNDKYNQCRNLIYFTSRLLERLNRRQDVIISLERAIELAQSISYYPFIEVARNRLKTVKNN